MTKIVYQTDGSGIFIGEVIADESPLEEGVFLIPGGCVETAPPEIPQGQRARWVDSVWLLEPDNAPADPSPPGPVSLAELKVLRRAAVDVALQNAFNTGYSHDFGAAVAEFEDGSTGPAGVQVLQTADDRDRTNWLTLKDTVDDLIVLGLGATPVKLRTFSNAQIAMSAEDAKAVLVAMRTSGMARLSHSWGLKAAIQQAADAEAVAAIDILGGWPG